MSINVHHYPFKMHNAEDGEKTKQIWLGNDKEKGYDKERTVLRKSNNTIFDSMQAWKQQFSYHLFFTQIKFTYRIVSLF